MRTVNGLFPIGSSKGLITCALQIVFQKNTYGFFIISDKDLRFPAIHIKLKARIVIGIFTLP